MQAGETHHKLTEMKISEEFIRKLPKTDLHVHLDGSLRMETVLELAREREGRFSPAEIKRLLVPGKKYAALEEYLQAFEITLSVMQTRDSLKRIAYELGEDCAAENVRYVRPATRRSSIPKKGWDSPISSRA